MNACIKEIAYALPEKIITNDDLQRENPGWAMARVEKNTGVRQPACRGVRRDRAGPGGPRLSEAFRRCPRNCGRRWMP